MEEMRILVNKYPDGYEGYLAAKEAAKKDAAKKEETPSSVADKLSKTTIEST